MLGATDEISIKQYCRVLEIIKNEANGSKVIPEEMNRSEKAIIGVLDCLKNEHTLEDLDKSGSILFLLNEKKKLKPSHELVIDDDSKLRRRMKCQTVIDFMLDLTMLKKDRKDLNPEELLMKLPQRMRPQKLSSIIKEIPLNTSDNTSSEMAVELESFISGDRFRYIATRIAKSYQKKMAEQVEDEELQQFLSKLKSLRVMALLKLETSLVYNGEHVIESTESQSVFFVEETNIMYIQGGIPLTVEWMAMNSHYIAHVIKIIFCNKVISEDLLGSLVYFRRSLRDIEQFLDRIGSVSIDFKIGEISWYPDPGTAVEEEFIDYLIADFLTFEAGDIVVYEHFDNAGDSNGQEVSVYIYAKIIRIVLNGTERFPIYLVNIGDGREIEVRSYRLYKIVRPSHATPTELELYTDGNTENRDTKLAEILQMIEETLVDAWNLGVEEFKRIVRRLVRRWHPDKNENSSFCADVFKHVMEFVKKLQSGLIDVSKINRYRGHSNNDWEECKQRATSSSRRENNKCYTFDVDGFADDIMRGYRRRRTQSRGRWSSGYHTNMTYIPDPQPHIARIWIKQAKYDIEAARQALDFVTDKSCNWVCVQSQQVSILMFGFMIKFLQL
jgi:sacsin